MRFLAVAVLSCSFVIGLASGCGADNPSTRLVRPQNGADWPRMLGAKFDSHSPEVGILTHWPASGLKVLWTADTGVGYGNGVTANGRWYQFDRFGHVERLSCLDASTGESQWKWESPVVYRDEYGYNDGPRCSPVADEERVYVYGVSGTLACISAADGLELWKINTLDEFNVRPNFFGVGASPLIYEDKILVMIGGRTLGSGVDRPKGSAMVALDKKTGQELYRVGNYGASYSAPIVHKIHGRDVCLALVREGLLAFDPTDGSKERFFPWRASTFESVNAASPVVWQDKIFISETYEIGSALLQLDPVQLKPLWIDSTSRKEQLLRAHWSTPLLHGNQIFASSGRNEPDTDLRCVELSSPASERESWVPKVHWAKRNHDRMTGLIVDDHLLMLGESGVLQLLELRSDKLNIIAQMPLADIQDKRDRKPLVQTPCWAPPVLSHGLLYVRGTNKVVCLELIPIR